MDVRFGLLRKLSAKELMLLNFGVGEDFWESFGLQGNLPSQSYRKSILNIHQKDWCWSWSSNTLAMWYEELTHWKRPWWWERLKVGGEGDDRGWDGGMASSTLWTWVWASSRRWWRTGKPGMLQFMGLQSQTQLSDWTTTIVVAYCLQWVSKLWQRKLRCSWAKSLNWREKPEVQEEKCS